jgi:hypothetical protein
MINLNKCRLILFIVIISFPGCFNVPGADADKEFRSLLENEWTSPGSELPISVCGWPVSKKMEVTDLNIEMFPDSTSKHGRGYADFSTRGDNFTCNGKLFFLYYYHYTGGHGYSGRNDIRVQIIQRESAVDEKISTPPYAEIIETGKKIEAELTPDDILLPDNSPADFYSIELKEHKPAIRFTDIKGDGVIIRGAVYQNRIFLSAMDETGVKLKPGRAFILITAGGKTGRYSFRVEELNEDEKSKLK